MENPLVISVFMITYNHEHFIEKAIKSVLEQKTSFPFEIVIGDDCSTDNTRNICINYHNLYPDIIRLILHEKNIGFQKNAIETIKACRGKYIAILEGDDFWTDPYKLQKQFEMMEANPDLAFCYTNANSFVDGDEESKEIMIKKKPDKNIFDLDCYIRNWYIIPTLTLFFRSSAFPNPIPKWLWHTFNLDWALIFLYLTKGRGAYIDNLTAMYRIHNNGIIISTSFPEKTLNAIELYKNLNAFFDFKYHHVFSKTQKKYMELIIYYFQKKKYGKGIYWLFFSFFRNPKIFLSSRYFLKTLYKVIFQNFEVYV